MDRDDRIDVSPSLVRQLSDNPAKSIGMNCEGEVDPQMVTGAKRLTDDMRHSPLPLWEGYRRRLTAERVNPSDAAVGSLS